MTSKGPKKAPLFLEVLVEDNMNLSCMVLIQKMFINSCIIKEF